MLAEDVSVFSDHLAMVNKRLTVVRQSLADAPELQEVA